MLVVFVGQSGVVHGKRRGAVDAGLGGRICEKYVSVLGVQENKIIWMNAQTPLRPWLDLRLRDEIRETGMMIVVREVLSAVVGLD